MKDFQEISIVAVKYIETIGEAVGSMGLHMSSLTNFDKDKIEDLSKDLLQISVRCSEVYKAFGKLDKKTPYTKEEEAWIAWYLVNPKATSDDALRYEELMKKNNVKKEKKV